LYLFDSFLNHTLTERPCATMKRSTDGTGLFVHFGFPFYYLKDAQAHEMLSTLFLEIENWQEPAELLFFHVDSDPRAVTFTWYLVPPDGPAGCHIERAGAENGYERLNDELIQRGEGNRFTFVDGSVASGSSYSYRLRVVEQWGGETVHGPWTVSIPETARASALLPPVPNPAPREVGIRYVVGQDNSWVEIAIHDCSGREVNLLRKGRSDAGDYSVVWDGKDGNGRRAAAGVYFVRARLGGRSFHHKVVLLR
jgi:hypothetical protein